MSIGEVTYKSTGGASFSSDWDRLMNRTYTPRTGPTEFERLLGQPRRTERLSPIPLARRQSRAIKRIARRLVPRPLGLMLDAMDAFGGMTAPPPPAPGQLPPPVRVINPALTFIAESERVTGGTYVSRGIGDAVTSIWEINPLLTLVAKAGTGHQIPDQRQTGWQYDVVGPMVDGRYFYDTQYVKRSNDAIYTYFARHVKIYRNLSGKTLPSPWTWVIPDRPLWPTPGRRGRRPAPVNYRSLPNLAALTWGGKSPPPPYFNVKGRPPPGWVEVKVRMTLWQAWVWHRLNDVSEVLEVVQMLYQASDGPAFTDPADQAYYLFFEGGWETIDWLELASLVGFNQIEDMLYGALGELTADASRKLNRPVGVTVGWAM